ncbi:haloacid dehalogenase superfamily, subfamily IA, variant 3 with third motif having DD or ED [Actinopolyspora xinjiangensis]|uniref:Haloacid dehalogenase superfamily, subfamily IA, variant 3 with third motif having DD or ED n=1 Tax=Actinopolyspora xinjiangensis TaxID=405564 RepID=A0A1H0N6A0_9ACTN|nr:HAD-IA family hydrolase [Actinopolyspora xinjiangensis]SDO88025.1 haloacid dehalogenase superfamily, subfamily IA, variant 3 with third motif having DD or ED [Actinopolyspora xinjiangensis]
MTLAALVVDYGGVLDDFGDSFRGGETGDGDERAPLVSALERLRNEGVVTALLSNGDRRPAELDCGRLFDVVAVSGETGLRKPEAASFRDVAERLELPPGRCVLLDDEPRNVTAAVAVGMVGVSHSGVRSTLYELSVLFDLDSLG